MDEGRHRPLTEIPPGARVAFRGRVWETDGDDTVERVRAGDGVLGRVVRTFRRIAPEVIELEVRHEDGRIATISGTPEHPFWVPAAAGYLPVRALAVGAKLVTSAGEPAIVVSKAVKRGDIQVYNFEVRGAHKYYTADVLTHNAKCPGFYHIKFASGCEYVGKGDWSRALRSGRERARANRDSIAQIIWASATDDVQALYNEAWWLELLGGPGDAANGWKNRLGRCMYNRIGSPGMRYWPRTR
jgi:hypothetical protein